MITLIGMGSGTPESLTAQGLAALQNAGKCDCKYHTRKGQKNIGDLHQNRIRFTFQPAAENSGECSDQSACRNDKKC